ncbi:MAG: hypothetical protein JXR23_02395 [Pontiellaceae bacterium]|nr:hypothetical protein [Pontiellaceae bacterium]
MKTSEKVYTALSLVFSVLFIMAIMNFVFFLIPLLERRESTNIDLFRYLSFLLGLCVLVLVTTAAVNLKQHELKTVATIVQITVLFLSGYGIPVAIWGIVLLTKKNREALPTKLPPLSNQSVPGE